MARNRTTRTPRGVRVTEQVHHELAEMIRGELKDPRLGMVTLTGVELTPDYAVARVWFTVLPDDEETVARTLEGLQNAAGFLRTKLARRVRTHTTPELRFVLDRSIKHGIRLSQLIDEANSRQADE